MNEKLPKSVTEYFAKMGRKGGTVTMSKRTPEERSAFARLGRQKQLAEKARLEAENKSNENT